MNLTTQAKFRFIGDQLKVLALVYIAALLGSVEMFTSVGAWLSGIWMIGALALGTMIAINQSGIRFEARKVLTTLGVTSAAAIWYWPKLTVEGSAWALDVLSGWPYVLMAIAGIVIAVRMTAQSDSTAGKLIRGDAEWVQTGSMSHDTVEVLQVPFQENDDVRLLGARWSPENRSWYIPRGVDRTPFTRWLPE